MLAMPDQHEIGELGRHNEKQFFVSVCPLSSRIGPWFVLNIARGRWFSWQDFAVRGCPGLRACSPDFLFDVTH